MDSEAEKQPVLSVRGLEVQRLNSSEAVTVLSGANVELRPGEWIDVVGPSGSGKSTLLEALARLIPVKSGEIFLNAQPAREVPPQSWRAQITYLPQHAVPLAETLRGELLYPWTLKAHADTPPPDEDNIRCEMDALALNDLAPEKSSRELSAGQLARIAFLRALLPGPRVLLLDEPAANLDAESMRMLERRAERFVQEGGAVIRVQHHGGHDAAGRVLELAGGTLVEAR